MTRQEIESNIRAHGLDPAEVLTHERASEFIGCNVSEVHEMLASGELASLARLDVGMAQAAFPPTRGVARSGGSTGLPLKDRA